MSIETALYTTLTTHSGVSALISTRVYPNPAPQGAAKPRISYSVSSGERITTLPGTGDSIRKEVTIESHADTYSGAKTLAAAVYSALEGNGYLLTEYDFYDDATQTHTVFFEWAFIEIV